MPEIVEYLEECECCGAYHRKGYDGDCRNDAERFPVPFLPYPGFSCTKENEPKGETRKQP